MNIRSSFYSVRILLFCVVLGGKNILSNYFFSASDTVKLVFIFAKRNIKGSRTEPSTIPVRNAPPIP